MFEDFFSWFFNTKTSVRQTRPPLALETLEDRLTPANAHFALIGDYGSAGPAESEVAALVRGWAPDFILTVGDNNYETGSAATLDANVGQYYHSYIGNYTGTYGAGSVVNRFFPALGNHDWQTRTGTPALPTPYLNYFTLPGNERYYTFTQGPVQFFALDSGDGSGGGGDGFEPDGHSSTSTQALWLQTQLASSTAAWKIVYFHHAPYSSGGHGSTTVMQWPFKTWGASAVLAGHEHIYERLNIDGLPYFINGLGGRSLHQLGTPNPGSELSFNGDFGAMQIDASDTQLRFQFITRAGIVIDSYTLDKINPVPQVTLTTLDGLAAEPGTDRGTIEVRRTGSTASALVVNLQISGTATNGSDYALLASAITIPVGATTATFQITPLDDGSLEGTESISLALGASGAYNRSAGYRASVTLADNDLDANQRYVMRLYLDLLGRGADLGGLQYFSGRLNTGVSRESVLGGILNSPEYHNRVVRRLYTQILHREADAGGLAYYTSFLVGGGSSEQLGTLLAGSPEYFARFGNNNAAFLSGLYRDLLGRSADSAGWDYFSSLLQQGVSRHLVAGAILASPEARGSAVHQWYATILRRNADLGGLQFYMAQLNSTWRDIDVIAALAGSPEYFSLAQYDS